MVRVRVDPGHGSPLPTGGTDPGAVDNGVQEAECVLEVSKLVAAMLRSQGVAIDLTRTTKVGPTSDARSKHLKQLGVNCSVSIHANAHTTTADGCEVFVSAFNPESRRLGELIVEEYSQWVRGIGLRKPAVRTRLANNADYYYFIRHPQSVGIPAVLVEIGFVTNPQDAAVLASFWGRFAIAYAISKGVLRWLGADLQGKVAAANERLANIRALAAQEV